MIIKVKIGRVGDRNETVEEISTPDAVCPVKGDIVVFKDKAREVIAVWWEPRISIYEPTIFLES